MKITRYYTCCFLGAGLIMRKISAYLLNGDEAGSPYYAVTQFLKRMNEYDIVRYDTIPRFFFRLYVDKMPKHKLGRITFRIVFYLIQWLRAIVMITRDILFRKPDTIIICREIFSDIFPFFAKPLYQKLVSGRNIVWTFDDHIFDSGEISPEERNMLFNYSDRIIVPNEYLRKLLPEEFHPKVRFVHPTDGDIPLDMHLKLRKDRKQLYETEIRIIWIGSASNIRYLRGIIHALDTGSEILKNKYGKSCKLFVVSNFQMEVETNYMKIINIRWKRDVAIKQMELAHIGIMPLKESKYTLGKSGCKLVQYLTAGLPSIASSVGYNENIISERYGYLIDDTENSLMWTEALVRLSVDWNFWERCSEEAFLSSQDLFSFQKDLTIWKSCLDVHE